ncbi:NAD(P)-binding protein [Thermocatellispora tengchongensis]|uniref:NAD(P)-binding protein n=1 Tax=Thermocatellispora tengchongensis TaxID=1073253 RepID=UPI00362A5971
MDEHVHHPPGPRRVAVVGAGPAGLFTADELVRQDRLPVTVDLLERLPVPFGLVRYGVAPDHPKIKAVTRSLQKIVEHPRVRFLGGVGFGAELDREDLLRHYDAVVYAAGAPPTGAWAFPASRRPAAIRPPRSCPGTAATPTPARPSRWTPGTRSWSAPGTSRWTWRGCWPSPPAPWSAPTCPSPSWTPWR